MIRLGEYSFKSSTERSDLILVLKKWKLAFQAYLEMYTSTKTCISGLEDGFVQQSFFNSLDLVFKILYCDGKACDVDGNLLYRRER